MKMGFSRSNSVRLELSRAGCLIWFLLSALVFVGCKRSDQPSNATEWSSETNTTPEISAPAYVAPTNFSVPFYGVIKAREQRDLMLNNTEITYTISKAKIRREKVQKAPLGKLAKVGLGTSGVICDIEKEEVLLYRSGVQGKFFVRKTLGEYRKLIDEKTYISDVSLHPLDRKTMPEVWRFAGTFFVSVPQPIPAGHAVNVPDSRKVSGLPCDVLTIKQNDSIWETSHCQLIKVDRELLELVELRIPSEVTGFPCLMRRLESVPVGTPKETESKAVKLLQKGVQLAAEVAEKAMKREVELFEITEGEPADSAFTLSDGFSELSELAEITKKFALPEGDGHSHHHDWD